MAINTGALLASTYQLPVQQPMVAPQERPMPQEDWIGDPLEGLQQVDGATDEYFQKWAALKGFAQEALKNYGVDIRYPDPSIPGSERLHRIFLKAVADLRAQGERLKTGQQMYMADRQRGALIQGDPRSRYYDEFDVGNDIVDAKLDPIVAAANDKLSGPHFGDAIEDAKAYHAQVKAMLEQRKAQDPDNAGYWQRQIDSLIEPIKAVRILGNPTGGFTPYQQGRVNAASAFLRKMTNLQHGNADSYKLSDKHYGPNGERVYISEDTSGEKYGNGTVVRYEYIPSIGKNFLVLRTKDGIRRLDLSEIDPMTHAKGYLDNVRYSANGEWLDIAADQAGYFTPSGEVAPENLLGSDFKERRQKFIEEASSEEALRGTKAWQALHGQLKNMETGFWSNDEINVKLANGKTAKIVVKDAGDGGKAWAIDNWRTVFPELKNDKTFKNQMSGLALNDMINFLVQQGAVIIQPPKNRLNTSGTSMLADPTVNQSGTESATTPENRIDLLP